MWVAGSRQHTEYQTLNSGSVTLHQQCMTHPPACLLPPPQVAQNYLRQDQLFHMTMHLPAALAGVSSAVQDILQQEFNREVGAGLLLLHRATRGTRALAAVCICSTGLS